MNRAQKIALFNIVVVILSLALSIMAVRMLAARCGFPDAYAGLALLGVCALVAVSPSMFKEDHLDDLFYLDMEKDIHRKSLVVAYGAFWIIFSAGCMIPALFLDPSTKLPANVLPMLLCASIITVIFVQSAATLVLYTTVDKTAGIQCENETAVTA